MEVQVRGVGLRTMVNMSTLLNKVAIVTGASKGIGGGIATALGAAGARVADAVLAHPILVEGLIPLFSSAASAHNVDETRGAHISAA
jgi:NAD(P)-dependent dehydrogenase (short-subunit alcohol dehydrogenase family)